MSTSPDHALPLANPWQGWRDRLADANRELWLLLSMFLIAGLLNWLVASHGVVLGLYTLPTLFSAYVFGRRHAVLTAIASILLILVLTAVNPTLLLHSSITLGQADRWFDLATWGGLLTVTAYAMGTLYERKEAYSRELRQTYFGVLGILQQFISNDKYTYNHSHRVAFYAAAIAKQMGLDEQIIDDIRAAALLHDIGKLQTNREFLYKAAKVNIDDSREIGGDGAQQTAILDSVGGSLRRVLPIILAHQQEYGDSESKVGLPGTAPVAARILAVADAYDTLTSDRPYRRAVSPFEAKDIIVGGASTDFDSKVVKAFVSAFQSRQIELPEAMIP